MTVVTTKQELEDAKERGDAEIIVKGELADKLKTSKKVTMVGAGTLAVLTGLGCRDIDGSSHRGLVVWFCGRSGRAGRDSVRHRNRCDHRGAGGRPETIARRIQELRGGFLF